MEGTGAHGHHCQTNALNQNNKVGEWCVTKTKTNNCCSCKKTVFLSQWKAMKKKTRNSIKSWSAVRKKKQKCFLFVTERENELLEKIEPSWWLPNQIWTWTPSEDPFLSAIYLRPPSIPPGEMCHFYRTLASSQKLLGFNDSANEQNSSINVKSEHLILKYMKLFALLIDTTDLLHRELQMRKMLKPFGFSCTAVCAGTLNNLSRIRKFIHTHTNAHTHIKTKQKNIIMWIGTEA